MTKLGTAKPFIIAEIGSNWETLSQAVESIGIAAACGAHAVKFQAFDSASLFGHDVPNVPKGIDLAWIPKLKEKADACGVEFMCTAFSPELVKSVDPFVSVHKIASSDNTWPELYQAIAETGKPVIVSCGATNVLGLAPMIELLKAPTYLLYCSAAYPARGHNLFAMEQLKKLGKPIGLSDHSLDVVYAPLSAVQHFGAVVIEKHFTAFDTMDTPDVMHSLNQKEFKIMCDFILGKVPLDADCKEFEEKPMFLRHNRRLIATCHINHGDVLQYGKNFGAYRSLVDDVVGLAPSSANMVPDKFKVTGKRATRAIEQGQAIGPQDFA